MPETNIYILTDPIHSGKTTFLKKIILNEENIYGILSPVINNKRFFVDVATEETFAMETTDDDIDVLKIGKYNFSKASFAKASSIIQKALQKNDGWIIIDEIGPLELKEQGFSAVLKDVIQKEVKTILVIRDSILEQVVEHFNIKNYNIIDRQSFHL